MKSTIQEILKESAQIKLKIAEELTQVIEEAAKKIIDSYKKGGKLLIFGNGGSAADAQHIATELTHKFEKNRKCIMALALTTNSCLITALSNDWSFEQLFERQIEGLANEKDVVIGISTSGLSTNVVRGIQQAKKNGAYTIALLGSGGGKIKDFADLSIIVPSNSPARIQESHITIGHILCKLIEDNLT